MRRLEPEPPLESPIERLLDANHSRDRFYRRLSAARLVAEASNGLRTRAPDLSVQSGLTPAQSSGLWSLFGAFIVFLALAAEALIDFFIGSISIVFLSVIVLRIAAALVSLVANGPYKPDKGAFQNLPDHVLPIVTILIPLYREANVVAQLAASLQRIEYPSDKLDIKFLVECGDDETIDTLLDIRLPPNAEIIPLPAGHPQTKPRALNFGLAFARGEIVAVYDAEDQPHPLQVLQAVEQFHNQTSNLAVVQAPLLAQNGSDSWISGQFEIEYAVHFRVWLPFIDRLDWPLALGGTSNFFRRDILLEVGGWDAWNVTEDADLGLRLARMGYTATMIDAPTLEEAPIHFSHWLNQRTRWMKGHLQTWNVLMRNPFKTARQIGLWGFFGLLVTLGGGLLAALFHGPILLIVIASLFIPGLDLSGWHATLFGMGYGSVLAAALASRDVHLSPVRLLSLPLYWPLHSIAMFRALWELKARPHYWAKTPHGVKPTVSPDP